jgi:polar amino acid transport system substrate-binding protein
VFITTNPAYHAFADLPGGEKVGVRLASTGHRELRTYLQALPEDQRPTQVPYPDNELLIERLADGTLNTIMTWEYAPYFATDGDLGRLGVTATFDPPFPVPPLQFGAVMLKQDTFVRGLIDDAIEEMTSSGVLGVLAAEYLPPSLNPA